MMIKCKISAFLAFHKVFFEKFSKNPLNTKHSTLNPELNT